MPVSGFNQSAGGSVNLGDGTATIDCGVSLATTTTLGVSLSGPTTFRVDTAPPTVDITSPANQKYLVGASVGATLSCSDPTPGSGIAAANGCAGTLDETTITSGTSLDTTNTAIGLEQ